MLSRLLDRLFGKRYVKGWPRGVRPMFPELHAKSLDTPFERWRATRGRPMFRGPPSIQRHLDEIEYNLEGCPGSVFVKFAPPSDPRVLDFP